MLALQLGRIQQREEHWVSADLIGKGGHVRTVPMPTWVKDAIDAWITEANITEGTVFPAGYLWCKQKLRHAANDRLGIEPDAA